MCLILVSKYIAPMHRAGGKVLVGLRGNPKDVDAFVMQEQSRRAVSSTTFRLLC